MKLFWTLLSLLKYPVLVVLICALSGYLFHQYDPVFGGMPDNESTRRISQSKNFVDGVFVNLTPTQVSTRSSNSKSALLNWVFPPEGKNPDKPLPSRRLIKDSLVEGSFVWLGHSTILMKTSDVVIMTDPVFNHASPVPLIGNSFAMQHKNTIKDLPAIDAVVISHDHYDHLDYQAIKELSKRVENFFVPLGIKAHLQRWGINESKISELDWYESELYRGVKLTLTPSRHFSGRKLDNQNATLWGSWMIESSTLKAYFSGDGGYSETFKQIGHQYGPFDIAFMENGAYNLDWSQIHMLPEEAVQASIDINAKVLFPIHWGKFDLALHPWDEPAIRITEEANKRGVSLATPLIGEVFDLSAVPEKRWWVPLRAEIGG
ncbi:MAG: L-ascorbate metabolism protein UlaG (beta-lactamase superfamily) [Gammaproteobacteria bacterium]|jgi:L-ascorbate metabolism protein UlaG (beta-lactamase superfamily)